MRLFRKRNLSDFTAWDAEKFKIERAKQVRPATVNRELTTLKSMMSAAVWWDYLTKNPFFGVKPLRVPKSPERILDEEEEEKLLNACSRVRASHLRPIVLLALNTGMRKGEILSLLWSQIDFASRTIRIENAKTKQGERQIPMNDTVYKVLSDIKQGSKSSFVFPSVRKPGHEIRDHKRGFRKAVRIARLAHIRFHDLRHTFATRLVLQGVDLITVQQLLGHAKITKTARYAHTADKNKIDTVKKLARKGFHNRAPIGPWGPGEAVPVRVKKL